jgi:polygalacturonase
MTSVRDFGARGDGKTDDTESLHHAIQRSDGEILFPRGDYVLSAPLYVPLELHGRLTLAGAGGTARLLMRGPGPAIYLAGTHRRTAQPSDFKEAVWIRERMPTIRDLEVVGQHAQADGIRLEGTMQATLTGLLIRQCRHGVHLTTRNRNVILADSHIYDCSGIGLFLDKVNLHQINIHGNHISYCKKGGIVVTGSEVRNIQICSNDIEYNFDAKAEQSHDIYFDCRQGTVREGTIVGNTIQASRSPGGANIRLVGVGKNDPSAVGLLAISGNLLGSQETVLAFRCCRGVVVSGNCIYSGYRYSLTAEDSEHLVLSGNSIDHNPEYKGKSTDQLVLRGCRNVNLTGLLMQHSREAEEEIDASVVFEGCENVNMTGCQVLGARSQGIAVRDSRVVRVSDSAIRPRQDDKAFKASIRVDGSSSVMVTNCFVTKGSAGDIVLPRESGVASGNVVV